MKTHFQELTIKVTKIGRRWHARLLAGNEVRDEMACQLKTDIGWICREMLRWDDKLGGCSKFAKAARRRQSRSPQPQGRIWHRADLQLKGTANT